MGYMYLKLSSLQTDIDNDLMQTVDPTSTILKNCTDVSGGQSILLKREKVNDNDFKYDSMQPKSVNKKRDCVPYLKQENVYLHTTLKQPTIILAAQQHVGSTQDKGVLSNVNIKVEPAENGSPPF